MNKLLIFLTLITLNTIFFAEQPTKLLSAPLKPNATTPQNPTKKQEPYNLRLVNIRTITTNIILDIRYATKNNFLKKQLYPEAKCLLRGVAAKQLGKVQEELSKQGLRLKVYDCYRPLSVQKLMWSVLPDQRYVGNPAKGSRHNRGAAVDLTLIDNNGKELEMPSAYDDFTEKAHRNYTGGSVEARKNRKLLEDVMKKYGFIPLSTEWWHFDAPGWEKFPILDVSFNKIP
ncbi:MAG: D-alanyl-D-alanine dipeptidase [Crinalium sp.]